MARNLQGFFGGGSDCSEYTVKIIANSGSDVFEEIYLAGDSPFVVNYDTTETPFEPIRFSRASINVVADEKFLDVFSEEAQGTKVILEKDGEIEWCGYLDSRLYNMPDYCGYDTFTLEAKDCLYSLEKYDYHTIGSHKSIVSFEKILGEIADKCGLLTEMYIDDTMIRNNGTSIEMKDLTISEQNFFYSDTDEPWNMRQVLEELCRYLGYTAVQYKSGLYLFDFQAHSSVSWNTEDADIRFKAYKYLKSNNWTSPVLNEYTGIVEGITYRQGIIRGSNSDISLETIYNKVQVKDSFYEIDHFVPEVLTNDALLTNKDGDFWKCNQISKTGTLTYLNKKGKPTKEEKDENEHIYYTREFNHKDYTSINRNRATLSAVTGEEGGIMLSNVDTTQKTTNYTAGTGSYVVSATFTNKDSVSHTIDAYALLRYDWWDGYHQMPDYNDDDDSDTFILAPGASHNVVLSCSTWYDTQYQAAATYSAWYNIDGSSTDYNFTEGGGYNTYEYISATITDLATFAKPMSTQQYNYETESNINFNRYIKIHQLDKPDRLHPYSMWDLNGFITPLRDDQIEAVYPALMKLNSGYYNPMIIDNKAYLALDTSAIFERYNVPYINPDWTDENTSTPDGLGLFNKTDKINTAAPCLIFKLKIGNKYYSGQSGWTTTDSCFVVNLGTDVLKNDKNTTDFTGWWNESHPALNNIDWTDWAGVSGYKIPLDNSLDFTQEIGFWLMMPSKMQEVRTEYQYDGMNNYCWVEKLDVQFATKMSENYDLSDVLYENVINSGSTNTLSDITCKFTTYPGQGKHSYSSVGLDGNLLTVMKKAGMDNEAAAPEANIVKAYANQYSSPTIKESMTIQSWINPFSYIKDITLNNKYFGILGTQIDYAMDRQTVTLIETKPWQNL